jgi:type IV secretory pathway VirB2 component (pilin)
MEFDLPRAAAVLVLIVAVGAGGLIGADMMPLRTTLMMVVPSMLVFGALAFALGVKHGEFRAGHA